MYRNIKISFLRLCLCSAVLFLAVGCERVRQKLVVRLLVQRRQRVAFAIWATASPFMPVCQLTKFAMLPADYRYRFFDIPIVNFAVVVFVAVDLAAIYLESNAVLGYSLPRTLFCSTLETPTI